MDLNELIKEHKRLVHVLKHGKKSELKRELKIQEKELRGYEMKKLDYCPHCRKRREHTKYAGYKLCKTCGYQEKY